MKELKTHNIPTKEAILSLIVALITATLIEMDTSIILILFSGGIMMMMFILDMIYAYQEYIKFLTKKLRKKEKTLD